MAWNIKQPYCPESKKIVWEVAPYLRGQGIDVGAGSFKVLPHAISVDNGCDNHMFGIDFKADITVKSAEEMPIFGTHTLDWVYSSHLLEHLEKPEKALKEWWRVLKPKGLLILYLPHEDLYPKVGEEGANPDHKHNLNEQMVIDWMLEVGKWDLERCERRAEDEEYSFLMVFRKRDVGHLYSHKDPKPEKTACVVRYGAFGDLMQTSSVLAGLKKAGYHVTLFTSPPGCDVVQHDPHIDKLVLFDVNQVPNADLGPFWEWQRRNFEKFVNLSESVEGSMLAMSGRTAFTWTPAARHAYMNHNYVEFAHKIAGIPHDPQIKFYTTPEERAWVAKQRRHMQQHDQVVMWSLAGSSVHKTWAGLDNIMASILVTFPKSAIVLVGGPEAMMLEAGWENEPRVYRTCGKWPIRQTFAFIDEVDLLIGPETGVMNAAACMDVEKVVFLSHSTHENLTRDWKNVTALTSLNTTCPGRGKNEAPACHTMHFGFSAPQGNCKRDEASGTAQCQADILVPDVWAIVEAKLQKIVAENRKVA